MMEWFICRYNIHLLCTLSLSLNIKQVVLTQSTYMHVALIYLDIFVAIGIYIETEYFLIY